MRVNQTMQNSIQRELTIKATQQRIYEAIADAKNAVKWFPDSIEGEYKPGNQVVFGFGSEQNKVLVVAAKPHHYFAFRWVPGANQFTGDLNSVPNTLVEFHISAQKDGVCQVTLTETGFNELFDDIKTSAFEQNSGGWTFMLDRLTKYCSAST